jgi:hypothetical protein
VPRSGKTKWFSVEICNRRSDAKYTWIILRSYRYEHTRRLKSRFC